MPTMPIGDGRHIYYTFDRADKENAPAVMLVHGLAESGEAWVDWMPRLRGRLHVLRPDLRGYGQSTPLAADHAWRFDDLSGDLAALMDHLGVPQVELVGAKIGGTIAMRLAMTRPELVRTLSVVGASPDMSFMAIRGHGWVDMIAEKGVEHWVRETTPARMGTDLAPDQVEWWIDLMSRTAASTLQGFIKMVPTVDVSDGLGDIRAPTLVITSSGGVSAVDDVRRWQMRIPNSRLVVVQASSYHIAGSHADRCAEEVVRLIDETAG